MDIQTPAPDHRAILDSANQALASGDWETSRRHFQQALELSEAPEAFEGLSMVAWWQDDVQALFDSRERAFALYSERGDKAGTARMASWLALDYYYYRRARSRSNGWVARARRFLDKVDFPSFEHCLFETVLAHISLEEHDVPAIKHHSANAIDVARRIESLDLEMLCLALYGLAEVKGGHVKDGMMRIDEAVTAARSGDLRDPDTIVTSCCHLIHACELVRDYERASEWCETVADLCQRWSYRSMAAYCRVRYATLVMSQGDWAQAERELTRSIQELMSHREGWAPEVYLRLAYLRLRQGRFEEVSELLDQCSEHPQALLGRAELALAQGDAVAAADFVDRYCRRVSRRELTELFNGLEIQIRVCVANRNREQAGQALADLEEVAEVTGTDAFRASVSYARGLVAQARGDQANARHCLEDAVDLYARVGAPYEAARARLELAAVLIATKRDHIAATECRLALDTLEHLGAADVLRKATALLGQIQSSHSTRWGEVAVLPGLTRRESEILQLIASGRSNPEIAEDLFLSIRTVERHISSIYQKIGAEGYTARAVATAYALEHGLRGRTDSGNVTETE